MYRSLRWLCYYCSLKKLVIKENEKLRAISHKTTLNQQQSAIRAPWDKRRWFKHRKFNQPFEIKAQNPRNPWVKTTKLFRNRKRSDHKLWKRKWVFEATKKRSNNLKKLFHALITIKPKSAEPERAFSATWLFATKFRNRLNDESVLWLSYVSSLL